MYQEICKYPAGTKAENAFYIARIVLGVFLVSILSWLLSSLGLPLMDFLAVGVLVVWAFVIFSRRIVEYRYSLMDSELIVARIVGGKEKPVLSLEVTDIQSLSLIHISEPTRPY